MTRRNSKEKLELHRILYKQLGPLWYKLKEEDQDEIVRTFNKAYTPEFEVTLNSNHNIYE